MRIGPLYARVENDGRRTQAFGFAFNGAHERTADPRRTTPLINNQVIDIDQWARKKAKLRAKYHTPNTTLIDRCDEQACALITEPAKTLGEGGFR